MFFARCFDLSHIVVVVLIEIVETKFLVFACFLSERIGVQYMCTRLCTQKIKRNIELATVSLFHPPAPHPTLFISKYIIFIQKIFKNIKNISTKIFHIYCNHTLALLIPKYSKYPKHLQLIEHKSIQFKTNLD